MPDRHSAAADWTRPITHMVSDSAVLPPPSRRKRRERHWECAELQHTPDTRLPGCPGTLAPRLSSVADPSKLGAAPSDCRPRLTISRCCWICSPLDKRCRRAHWCCHLCAIPAGLEPPRRRRSRPRGASVGADALPRDAPDRFLASVVADAGIVPMALALGGGANPRQARGRESS